MNIDQGTEVGIELASEGVKLSLNLIAYIFRVTANSLEKNENIIEDKTKTGKQKLKSLLEKHKQGVETLDENLTKLQVKEYQKELKKLGVDFSVIKNGKDNYSFFFSSGQASVIEKALKNIIHRENLLQNNDKYQDIKLETDSELHGLNDKEKEKLIEAYTEYYTTGNREKFNELNYKGKKAFNKMEELDNVKKEVEKNIDNTEDDQSYSKNKDVLKDKLKERLSSLKDDELKLYEKSLEYDILSTSTALEENKVQEVASELKQLKSKYPKKTIDKIKNIDKDLQAFDKYADNKNKLTSREILKEVKNKTFSIENVKKIDREIKRKEAKKEKTKFVEKAR